MEAAAEYRGYNPRAVLQPKRGRYHLLSRTLYAVPWQSDVRVHNHTCSSHPHQPPRCGSINTPVRPGRQHALELLLQPQAWVLCTSRASKLTASVRERVYAHHVRTSCSCNTYTEGCYIEGNSLAAACAANVPKDRTRPIMLERKPVRKMHTANAASAAPSAQS